MSAAPIFTELQLTFFAVCLYILISPIHGISTITKPLLKLTKFKSETSLLIVS